VLSITDILQMDLINECSLRFAEDKDFRLLVRTNASFVTFEVAHSIRSWTLLWLSFASTFRVAVNSAKDNRRQVFKLASIYVKAHCSVASTSRHKGSLDYLLTQYVCIRCFPSSLSFQKNSMFDVRF